MPQFLSNLSLDLFPQHDTLSFMHRDDSDDSHINMSYFPAVVMNFHSSIQHVFAQNDWGMGVCADQPQNTASLSKPQVDRINIWPQSLWDTHAQAKQTDRRA